MGAPGAHEAMATAERHAAGGERGRRQIRASFVLQGHVTSWPAAVPICASPSPRTREERKETSEEARIPTPDTEWPETIEAQGEQQSARNGTAVPGLRRP